MIFLLCVLFYPHHPSFEIQANCTHPFITPFLSASPYIFFLPSSATLFACNSSPSLPLSILSCTSRPHISFYYLPPSSILGSLNSSLHSQPILHPSLHLPPFPSFHPSTIPSHPITTQLEVLIRKGGGAIWCGRPLIETPISLLWTSVCRGSSQSFKNHISISRLFF